MKVAVLIYGMYVEFEIAATSWNFVHELDCDLYMSTWNKSKKFSEKLNFLSEYDVSEDMIKSIFPKINLVLLDQKNYFFKTGLERLKFHWMNCINEMENSKIKYDILILTRPENYFRNYNYKNFLNFTKKDRIYGLDEVEERPNGLFVQDIFFMGDYEIMIDFLKTFPTLDGDLHGGIPRHALSKNLLIEEIKDFNSMTLRPNCSQLKNDELNYENLWKKVQEWG